MNGKRTGRKSRKPAMPGVHGVRVRLERNFPGASSVCLAGSFNDWHPAATDMINLGNGHWGKDLVLPPGSYEYRLVVDGQWMSDPDCAERVTNPFGTENCVLRVDGT